MTQHSEAGSNHRAPSGIEGAMWDTRHPLDPGFAADWNRALDESTHAHFAMDLDWLKWEAAQHRHARALLFDGGSRRGLVVQRRSGLRWVSGWPWRWQALVTDGDPMVPHGMTAADAAWLHDQLCRWPDSSGHMTFLPYPPTGNRPGWIAGATVIQELGHSDEELLQGMEPSKRRLLRRALQNGFEIRVAQTEQDRRDFHVLQQKSKARRGLAFESTPDRVDRSGESWREWELPWMWLLVARRNDELHAGLGDGVRPGGAMQGRAAASTLEARHLGANVLLGYEETRRGRDLGHRWLNHGGDTPFKREMSGRLGRRIRVFAWLGSGRGPTVWQRGEAAIRGIRPALARLRRRFGVARHGMTVVTQTLAFLPMVAELPVLV